MAWIEKIISWFSRLVFPLRCIVCGAEDFFICPSCESKIPVRTFNDSWEKLVHDEHIDRIFIASWYENKPLQEMIKYYKYMGRQSLKEEFSRVVYRFWDSSGLSDYFVFAPVVVPLPLHRRRLYERGYNQSALLAFDIAQYAELIYDETLLLRKKYTRHQTDLPLHQRSRNIQGVFRVVAPSGEMPHSVLLIDDVVTTGASMNEAAYVLKNAGAKKVYGLVLAKN